MSVIQVLFPIICAARSRSTSGCRFFAGIRRRDKYPPVGNIIKMMQPASGWRRLNGGAAGRIEKMMHCLDFQSHTHACKQR